MTLLPDKAQIALVASLALLKRESASIIDSHTLHDPETRTPLLDTLDDDVRADIAEFDNAIEEALDLPAEQRAGGCRAQLTRQHDPRAYGVTVTVDVVADSFRDATKAFDEDVGIQHPEGLVFHVEHLNTGQLRGL